MACQFILYVLLLQSLSSFCWQPASGRVGDFYIVSQVKVQSSYFTLYMVGCIPYDSILVLISVQVPSCNVGRCFGVWTNSYGPLFVTLQSNAILCTGSSQIWPNYAIMWSLMDNIRLRTMDVRGLVRCRKIVAEVGNSPGEGMLSATRCRRRGKWCRARAAGRWQH